MASTDIHSLPFFSAVSSSARQLYLLLKCINFAPKALVQITANGLQFSAEETSVMQGNAFLGKELFSSYIYNPPQPDPEMLIDNEPEVEGVIFQISLTALIETLQIFGFNDNKERWTNLDNSISRGGAKAFDKNVLGMSGVCRLSYAGEGEPFCVVLEETGVTTKCELMTYTFEPEMQVNIQLDRSAIVQRIITRASWLYDAITELSSTSPTRLTITSSPTAPCFTLSSRGPLGSASVEFFKDPQLLETFEVQSRSVNAYKYSMIRAASRAMAIANKVSIRTDEQGVLSLQFMIEVAEKVTSFVDFRFLPLMEEDGDEADEGDESDEMDEEDE
ncbi:MAG: ssDNA endodeoxyribonuclease [Cirrosporium novae-zelandiae]|nr:MAG: ssDNA endodeoxyribonuclease [Cirrosporium novae-zelandiae]